MQEATKKMKDTEAMVADSFEKSTKQPLGAVPESSTGAVDNVAATIIDSYEGRSLRRADPFARKQQTNVSIPALLVTAVRAYADYENMSRGEAMSLLLREALQQRAPQFLDAAYNNECKKLGINPDGR